MKTKRIQIEKDETVELYIAKRNRANLNYSSIAVGDGGRIPEQKRISTGLRATMKLVGPVTLCLVVSKK